MKTRSGQSELTLSEYADRVVRVMPRLVMIMTATERNYLARGLITLPQARVLIILNESGPCSMRRIARALGLQASTITNLVDRLARLGLVVRRPSDDDRRVVMVRVTAKGGRVLRHIMEEKRKTAADMYAQLSPRERRVHLTIMEKLVDRMTDRSRAP